MHLTISLQRLGAAALCLLIGACGGGGGGATAPAFASGPLDLHAVEGEAYTFSATLADPGATLQWRRDGVAVAGATGDALAGTATAADDGARFELVARSAAGGEAGSGAAVLRVSAWAEHAWPADGSLYPDLRTAVAANGDTLVAWCEVRTAALRVLVARRYTAASQRWGAAEVVGVNCVGVFDLAGNAAGDALLAWTDYDDLTGASRAGVRRYDAASGRWGATQSLPAAPGRVVSAQKAAMGSSGDAAVLVTRFGGGTIDLQLMRFAAGAWLGPERLAAFRDPGILRQGQAGDMDMAPNGDVTAAWLTADGAEWLVQSQRYRRSDNTLELPQTHQRAPVPLGTPRLARHGEALSLAWASLEAGAPVLQAAPFGAAGWSAPARRVLAHTAVSPPVGAPELLWYVLAGDGSASAALESRLADGTFAHARVERSPAGTWEVAAPTGTAALEAGTTARSLQGLAHARAEAAGVIAHTWLRPGATPTLHHLRTRAAGAWAGGVATMAADGALMGLDSQAGGPGWAAVVWSALGVGSHDIRVRLLRPVQP